MHRKQNFLAVLLCTLSLTSAATVFAQAAGIQRTIVQKADVSVEKGKPLATPVK